MRYTLLISLFITISFSAHATQRAAVAMPDRYSAEVAYQIIQAGGNAVDAAVAASFSLAVTYPEAGNLGGGGFMLIHFKGENRFLDYRETAPKAAHPKLFLDEAGEVIPYQSLLSYQASGVPGSVLGMWEAHQRYGQLDWTSLLAPAIKLAEDGFIVDEQLAQTATWFQTWSAEQGKALNFEDYFAALKSGERFVQPELARTLTLIAQQGPQVFYKGRIAELIADQMQQNGGLISLEDLANYQVKWRQPLIAKWQGYEVVSAPPPSSGGLALLQLLTLKQLLHQEFEGLSHNSSEYIHLLAEIKKRVYADRAEYLGDPDFVAVPVDRLLNREYLLKRALEIDPIRISPTEAIQPGLVESEQTTHFSIVDEQGNAVSNTTTLNMPFGNGVVIEGAGFLMNNQMDDFSAKPGVPNAFGVLGGQANAIEAGKRMLSSMTPTILLKDNQPEVILGTPGGSTIITSVFQTLVNLIEFDMSAQQAVNETRVHHQLWPKDEIGYHPELEAATIQTLTDMGYQVKARRFLGDVQLIVREDADTIEAAADKRGRGKSLVWQVK